MHTTITPGQSCPVCQKRHRAGSKPLAACQAILDKRQSLEARTEASAYPIAQMYREAGAEVPEAATGTTEAPRGRAATWTEVRTPDDRGVMVSRSWAHDSGRWYVARFPGNVFRLYGHGSPVDDYGLLSDAVDRAEETELGEEIVASGEIASQAATEAEAYRVAYRHPALGEMTSQALTREELGVFLGICERLGASVLSVVSASLYNAGMITEAVDGMEHHQEAPEAQAPEAATPDYQMREGLERAHKTLTKALGGVPGEIGSHGYASALGALEACVKAALIDIEVYGGVQ